MYEYHKEGILSKEHWEYMNNLNNKKQHFMELDITEFLNSLTISPYQRKIIGNILNDRDTEIEKLKLLIERTAKQMARFYYSDNGTSGKSQIDTFWEDFKIENKL